MRRKGSLLGFTLVVLWLLGASTAHSAFPGREGRIAYSRLVNGAAQNWEIVTINRDGTGYQGMTFDSEIDDNAAWSADGAQIAFESDRSGDFELYTVEDSPAFRSPIRRTISPGYDGQPTWSPDGTKIAFRRGEGTAAEIWVMNADGTGQTQITSNVSFDDAPAWSPDGTKIAFHSDRDDPLAYELYTMDPDGTNVTRLTTSAGEDANPNWHPDGSQLIFDSDRAEAGRSNIYRMNASPGEPADQLTNQLSGEALRPAWSPDGTKIAFDRGASIWVANADGTGQVPVVEIGLAARFSRSADWQPLPGPEPPSPYDHPAAAQTLRVPLVPEFRQTISTTQCQARGGMPSMHGGPLSFAACEPPGYRPGTQARLGSQGTSYVELTAVPGDVTTAPNEANVVVSAQLHDVWDTAGGDYHRPSAANDMRFTYRVRLSDTQNGSRQLSPGTVIDYESWLQTSCTPTADPSIGSSCAVSTKPEGLTPHHVFEGRSSVVQLYRVRALDLGPNAYPDSDDRTFATQGIYIP